MHVSLVDKAPLNTAIISGRVLDREEVGYNRYGTPFLKFRVLIDDPREPDGVIVPCLVAAFRVRRWERILQPGRDIFVEGNLYPWKPDHVRFSTLTLLVLRVFFFWEPDDGRKRKEGG